jgi:hypothetical protein
MEKSTAMTNPALLWKDDIALAGKLPQSVMDPGCTIQKMYHETPLSGNTAAGTENLKSWRCGYLPARSLICRWRYGIEPE